MVALIRVAGVVLMVGVVFAGCIGTAKTSGTDPVAELHVAATPTTGVVRGLVVDPAIHPIPDVRLTLKEGDKVRITNSSATGAFGFEGLAPGTYFISAHKHGFIDAQVSTEVVAGVSEPVVTKVALAPNPSDKPYVEVFVFKGFLQCGITTPVVGVAVCFGLGSASSDNTQVHYSFAANLSWVQSEMIWQATNPAGADLNLWHSYTCPPQTLYCDHGPRGPSPLLVTDNATWIETLGLNAATPLYMRVFSAELDGTHPPAPADNVCAPDPALGGQVCVGGVGAVVNQDFVIYTHAFHGFLPPDGYRFSKDGDPVPPPL